MNNYFSNIFKFLLIFLLASTISVAIKYCFTKSDYEDAISRLEAATDDIQKERASIQLKEISARQPEINKLVSYCLTKEVTPPIHISDMKACREKALQYLSLPTDIVKLKELSHTPLNKDLNICTNIQSYKLK